MGLFEKLKGLLTRGRAANEKEEREAAEEEREPSKILSDAPKGNAPEGLPPSFEREREESLREAKDIIKPSPKEEAEKISPAKEDKDKEPPEREELFFLPERGDERVSVSKEPALKSGRTHERALDTGEKEEHNASPEQAPKTGEPSGNNIATPPEQAQQTAEPAYAPPATSPEQLYAAEAHAQNGAQGSYTYNVYINVSGNDIKAGEGDADAAAERIAERLRLELYRRGRA